MRKWDLMWPAALLAVALAGVASADYNVWGPVTTPWGTYELTSPTADAVKLPDPPGEDPSRCYATPTARRHLAVSAPDQVGDYKVFHVYDYVPNTASSYYYADGYYIWKNNSDAQWPAANLSSFEALFGATPAKKYPSVNTDATGNVYLNYRTGTAEYYSVIGDGTSWGGPEFIQDTLSEYSPSESLIGLSSAASRTGERQVIITLGNFLPSGVDYKRCWVNYYDGGWQDAPMLTGNFETIFCQQYYASSAMGDDGNAFTIFRNHSNRYECETKPPGYHLGFGYGDADGESWTWGHRDQCGAYISQVNLAPCADSLGNFHAFFLNGTGGSAAFRHSIYHPSFGSDWDPSGDYEIVNLYGLSGVSDPAKTSGISMEVYGDGEGNKYLIFVYSVRYQGDERYRVFLDIFRWDPAGDYYRIFPPEGAYPYGPIDDLGVEAEHCGDPFVAVSKGDSSDFDIHVSWNKGTTCGGYHVPPTKGEPNEVHYRRFTLHFEPN